MNGPSANGHAIQDQPAPNAEQTSGLALPSRPTTAQTSSPASSRPNSARRKSWLPANTRDPVVRDNWFSEVLLVLTAVDKHLASGFETAYPSALNGFCKESVWSEFIKDINRAAKLKRKHKFALVFKPMVSKVRIIRQAIDAHLDRRTKPMLIMLKYWQDILKSYGLRAELRKGGQSIDKRVPPPTGHFARRSSDLFSSADSTISSRNSIYRSPSAAASQVDFQSDCPIRPPFLHANASRASLASTRSLAIETYDTQLAGSWELVIYSVKKRSELRSLYTRSRRYSTLSLTGSMKAGRPTTAYMLGEDNSPTKNGRRQSRAKILSLEELAKLPLPPSRSPFNLPKEAVESTPVVTDDTPLHGTDPTAEDSCDAKGEPGSAVTTTKPDTVISKITSKRRSSMKVDLLEKSQQSVDLPLPPLPKVIGPMPTGADQSITQKKLTGLCTSKSSQAAHAVTCKAEPKEAALSANKSSDAVDLGQKDNLTSRKGANSRVAPSRSPLSAMAITAENLSSDLDDFAESSRKQGNLALNNRFSVANFLSLASSVLPRSTGATNTTADKLTTVSEGEAKIIKVEEKTAEIHKAIHRTRSSSFLTVLTPMGGKSDKTAPTVRVVTTPMEVDGAPCEIRPSTLNLGAA